jgi:hypothetical protein
MTLCVPRCTYFPLLPLFIEPILQACVSTYHQLDYLFSYNAGSLGLSDTGQMQRYLFLPYWFWGLLMAIASLVILVQSLRVIYSTNQQ